MNHSNFLKPKYFAGTSSGFNVSYPSIFQISLESKVVFSLRLSFQNILCSVPFAPINWKIFRLRLLIRRYHTLCKLNVTYHDDLNESTVNSVVFLWYTFYFLVLLSSPETYCCLPLLFNFWPKLRNEPNQDTGVTKLIHK